MKKLFTLSLLAVAAQVASAVELVYDEPITEAPAGTVYSDVMRSASVFFFSEYGFDYDATRTGMPGEYIVGDDGCIYIKEPISGYQFGTYLKLDKVDDETYVAHTLQVAAVSSALEPVFVVRLVFNQLSETSFTYQLEQDEAGNDLTDIYFTYKDGNLEQRDRETINMNGVIYPHEIIALANTASGDWNGYGDGLLSLRLMGAELPAPPADAEIVEATLTYTSLYDRTGYAYPEANMTRMAEAGDKLYIANPAGDQEAWWVGDIDRQAGTVTFQPQYLGSSSESYQWLVPATYTDWYDGWEEDDYGLWERTNTKADVCVLRYENGVISADADQALIVSGSENVDKALKSYCGLSIKPGVAPADAKPAAPEIINFSAFDDFWWQGSIHFVAAPLSTKGLALDINDLYINVYHDGETEPYAFTSSDSYDLDAPTVDLPYDYAGESFTYAGSRHRFYFYNNWQDVGIQLVYRHEGNETRSAIAWAVKGTEDDEEGGDVTALQSVNAAKELDGKRLENGRLVIRKDGVEYNVIGNLVK